MFTGICCICVFQVQHIWLQHCNAHCLLGISSMLQIPSYLPVVQLKLRTSFISELWFWNTRTWEEPTQCKWHQRCHGLLLWDVLHHFMWQQSWSHQLARDTIQSCGFLAQSIHLKQISSLMLGIWKNIYINYNTIHSLILFIKKHNPSSIHTESTLMLLPYSRINN